MRVKSADRSVFSDLQQTDDGQGVEFSCAAGFGLETRLVLQADQLQADIPAGWWHLRWDHGWLCVNAAPQQATTRAEYFDMALETIRALWDSLTALTLDHEWFSQCGGVSEDELMHDILQKKFQGALQAAFPHMHPDTVDILSQDGKQLTVYVRYDNLTHVELPYSETLDAELAVLIEVADNDLSPDRSLEGVHSSLANGEELKLVPLLVFPMDQHVQIPGLSARHAIASPAGIHPRYSVQLLDDATLLDHFNEYQYQCSLHLQVQIPKQIFLDQYQLQGLMGRPGDTSCITHIEMSNEGAVDLELPDYSVSEWGSTTHLQLDPECVKSNGGKIELPLHLRYSKPHGSGSSTVRFPAADLYWKCALDEDRWDLVRQSFAYERGYLGIDKLDEVENFRYFHYPKNQTSVDVNMPVAVPDSLAWIQISTLVIVLLGTIAILISLLGGSNNYKQKTQDKKSVKQKSAS